MRKDKIIIGIVGLIIITVFSIDLLLTSGVVRIYDNGNGVLGVRIARMWEGGDDISNSPVVAPPTPPVTGTAGVGAGYAPSNGTSTSSNSNDNGLDTGMLRNMKEAIIKAQSLNAANTSNPSYKTVNIPTVTGTAGVGAGHAPAPSIDYTQVKIPTVPNTTADLCKDVVGHCSGINIYKSLPEPPKVTGIAGGGVGVGSTTESTPKFTMSTLSPFSVTNSTEADWAQFLKDPAQYSRDKALAASQDPSPVVRFMNDPGSNPELRDKITTVVSLPGLVYAGYSALNFANSMLNKAVGNAVPDFGEAFRTNTSNIEDVPMEDFYNVGANSNALIKLATGMDLTDPNINQKLIDDVNIIRAKYNLPPRQMLLENPREYLDQVSALAKKEGIQIRPDYEVGGFFEQNPLAGGVTLSPSETGASGPVISAKTVSVFTGEKYLDTLKGTIEVARTMEHEYIHGVQSLKFASMPVDIMEYEAYMAAKNTTALRNLLPADIDIMLTFPKLSIEHYYKEIGQIPLYLK